MAPFLVEIAILDLADGGGRDPHHRYHIVFFPAFSCTKANYAKTQKLNVFLVFACYFVDILDLLVGVRVPAPQLFSLTHANCLIRIGQKIG